MKVVILAGGYGTRLSEETVVKPKPMVEVAGKPILWHIMKHYAHHGFKEFVIALGYKGEVIKRYFLDYYALNSDITIDLSTGDLKTRYEKRDDWIVHLIDTGLDTLTGGRVKRLEPWLKDETFMLTYGDGLADVDLHDLLRFHRHHDRVATVTAVRQPARFGGLTINGDIVNRFVEKPENGEGMINGGFMVFEPGIYSYLKGDNTSLEADVLEQLAKDKQLGAYRHTGFWQCIDTPRDLRLLESLWQSGKPPWKVWE